MREDGPELGIDPESVQDPMSVGRRGRVIPDPPPPVGIVGMDPLGEDHEERIAEIDQSRVDHAHTWQLVVIKDGGDVLGRRAGQRTRLGCPTEGVELIGPTDFESLSGSHHDQFGSMGLAKRTQNLNRTGGFLALDGQMFDG